MKTDHTTKGYIYGIIGILIMLLIIFGGIFYMDSQEKQIRHETEEQISKLIDNSNLTNAEIIGIINIMCTSPQCKDDMLKKYILNKGESTNAD